MRLYKEHMPCPGEDGVVDLDDPKTYDFMSLKTEGDIDIQIQREIGFAHCYFNYWNKDWDKSQIERVEILIERYTRERKDNYGNVMWFKEMLFLFQDEMENMC